MVSPHIVVNSISRYPLLNLFLYFIASIYYQICVLLQTTRSYNMVSIDILKYNYIAGYRKVNRNFNKINHQKGIQLDNIFHKHSLILFNIGRQRPIGIVTRSSLLGYFCVWGLRSPATKESTKSNKQ